MARRKKKRKRGPKPLGTTQPLPKGQETVGALCRTRWRKRRERESRERGCQIQESSTQKDVRLYGEAGYLRSPFWRDLRGAYKAAWPNCACLNCGHPKFQLHHVTYERAGHEELRDLIPLCQGCHKIVHRAHRELYAPVLASYFEAVLRHAFNWSPAELQWRLRPYYNLP
jgi:hypothetical protein